MNRTVTPLSNAKNIDTIIGETNSAVSIIVIISMVTLTAFGGYIFLKRRKEN